MRRASVATRPARAHVPVAARPRAAQRSRFDNAPPAHQSSDWRNAWPTRTIQRMPRFTDVQVVQSTAPRWPTIARGELSQEKPPETATEQATEPERARRQNEDRLHEIDGCSGGVKQDPTNHGGLYIGYVWGEQRYNQASTAFGSPQDAVAHSDLSAVLPLPCNQHDICYQTCGSDQAECDEQMLADMISVCEAAYPEACPAAASEKDDCDGYADERNLCLTSANRMYMGLRAFGSRAYEERQEQYCVDSSEGEHEE